MSTRDTMLEIARGAILYRASLDGYEPDAYDPAEDDEGYVTSLLTALRHWCDTNSIDWQAELARAQELFEEDMLERSGGASEEADLPKPPAPAPEPAPTQHKAKPYTIGVREVHVRFYSVEAEDEEQAKELVHQRAPSVVDCEELEYSHELSRDTWSVEENTENNRSS